ncbi:protein CMSS1 [Orycteropus afer afer]|uniref:Protein CMSS1 n=1 Tax=Orycteropus afer afer TaxID=1230840 RepID=A0A8B7A7Q0_ORYAF|nr:protein CMSS1 [Orycteropus afer afer]
MGQKHNLERVAQVWKLRRIWTRTLERRSEEVTSPSRGGGYRVWEETPRALTPAASQRVWLSSRRRLPPVSAHYASLAEMADDLGDEWWENQPSGAAISPEASDGEEGGGDTEMMQQETAPIPALSKKAKQPKECFLIQPKEMKEEVKKTRRRKKKKITDVLAKSEPKPGTPEDLQKLMKDYYSNNRSVIELEELSLPDSCFLKANDLTHSLSSYLKEICPKWVKLRKNHKEKKSVLMLIICSSAIRALELIRSMTAFKGDSKVMKLFAKHIKIQEQIKLLEKRVVHLGVGTPGRIKELVKQGGLNLNSLKFLVFDWNWRDQKLRRLMDIPEIRKEVFELLEMGVFSLCKSESLKLGLF